MDSVIQSFDVALRLQEHRVRMALIQHREPALPIQPKPHQSRQEVVANVMRQLVRTYETNTKKHELPRSPRRYFAGAAQRFEKQAYDRQRHAAKVRAEYSESDWLPYDEASL